MFKFFSRNFSFFTGVIILFALAVLLYPSSEARASGVVGTCNEATFSTVLATAGTITFNCDGIINITSVKTISSDTIIDAAGHNITLDGGGNRRIFDVNTGIALTLINLRVQNASAGTGGAIATRGGILTIQNSTFISNTATGTGSGGAIFADVVGITGTVPVRVTIENSLFENNSAPGQGGAIFVDGGEAGVPVGAFIDIKNSTFRNNRTTEGGDGGAILANFHVTLNSEGSLYMNNLAEGSGGAIGTVLADVQVNLANNTFSGNRANTDNSGGTGGALDLKSGSLVHNTFYGNGVNEAGTNYQGSAIHWASTTLTVVSRDNIFHNNTLGNFECAVGGIAPYGSGNLTDDGSCNGGSTPAAVDFFDTTLSDNGGPTLTHALLAGSNAIDTASACTYASSGTNPLFSDNTSVLRDQRGAARPYDGDGGVDVNECDKGAYEVREVLQSTCNGPDLTGMQTFTFADGKTVTIAINQANGLNCITVEQMGRQHESGIDDIQASNNWWRISGNVDSGFDINLTLPANYVPDTGDQVCRYTGDGTQTTWNCAVSSMTSSSLTRNNVTQFSDWAILEDQDPTAVQLTSLRTQNRAAAWNSILPAGLLALAGLVILKRKIE